MAGRVINIIPPRLFDFTNLALNGETTIVLAKAIDVSQWPDATLMVRINDTSLVGGELWISTQYVSPTADDPGADFVVTAPDAFIYIEDGQGPTFTTVQLTPPLGSAIRVNLTAYRWSSDPMSVVFSIDMKVTNYFPS
jgi:hypothetical protein